MLVTLVSLVDGTGDVWDLEHFVRHTNVLQALCLGPAAYYSLFLQLILT